MESEKLDVWVQYRMVIDGGADVRQILPDDLTRDGLVEAITQLETELAKLRTAYSVIS